MPRRGGTSGRRPGSRGRPSGHGGRGSERTSGSSGTTGNKATTGSKGKARNKGASGQRGASGRRGASGSSRDATGLDGTQVEGRRAVRELLLAGRRETREVFLVDDPGRSGLPADIVDLAHELHVPVREVSRSKLDHMARTEAPQGVLAKARPLPAVGLEELCTAVGERTPFLLALDGVTDPGNLGALLRTAECAGVTGVVLPRHRAVHITPTVTKAAAGAVEHLPMSVVGGLPAALGALREAGVWLVGLDATGGTSVQDLTVAGEPVCLVLGAEGSGLSRLVAKRCDVVASIPLYGALSSLNVASAGAVACYEVARRRR